MPAPLSLYVSLFSSNGGKWSCFRRVIVSMPDNSREINCNACAFRVWTQTSIFWFAFPVDSEVYKEIKIAIEHARHNVPFNGTDREQNRHRLLSRLSKPSSLLYAVCLIAETRYCSISFSQRRNNLRTIDTRNRLHRKRQVRASETNEQPRDESVERCEHKQVLRKLSVTEV